MAAELEARLAGFDAELARRDGLATSLVAIQGPACGGHHGRSLTEQPLDEIRNYGAAPATVAGVEVLLARTGYTGEDGFELFCAWDDGPGCGQALLEAGCAVLSALRARVPATRSASKPACRSMATSWTARPRRFEAGLGWAVQLERDPFVGRDALARQRRGPRKQLVGLVLRARGIARHGYPVTRRRRPDAPIGVVTSGSQSPTLGEAIAMAYVRARNVAAAGTMLDVIVRGAAVPRRWCRLPFYRRPGR